MAHALRYLFAPHSLRILGSSPPAYELHRLLINSRRMQCVYYSIAKKKSTKSALIQHVQELESEEVVSKGNTEEQSSGQTQARSRFDPKLATARRKSKVETKEVQQDVELVQVPIAQEPKDTLFNFGKIKRSLESMKETLSKQSTIATEIDEDGDPVPREIKVLHMLKNARHREFPETEKLAKHVNKYDLAKTDLKKFANSIPSIIGSSIKDVRRSVTVLQQAGLTVSEICQILPNFPPFLAIDLKNVAAVYKLMRSEHKFPPHVLKVLLRHQPHIFTQDEAVVRKQLDSLKDLGLSALEIEQLLFHFPMLSSVPLSEQSIEEIKSAMSWGLDSRWLSEAIAYNMHLRPAKLTVRHDAEKTVSLLREYGLDVSYYVTKYPEILQSRYTEIQPVLQALSGKPLYMNTPDMYELLMYGLRSFLQLKDTDMVALRSHLTDLCELFGSADKARWEIRSVHGLILPQCDVGGKMELLSNHGFSREEAVQLLTTAPSLLVQDIEEELGPKLKLVMSINGMTPSVLANSSARMTCLHKSYKHIQARCSFARQYNESLLDVDHLKELVLSTNKHFAKLCNQSLETYQTEALTLRDSETELETEDTLKSAMTEGRPSTTTKDKANINQINTETKTFWTTQSHKATSTITNDILTTDNLEHDTTNKSLCVDATESSSAGEESPYAENPDPPIEVIANLEECASRNLGSDDFEAIDLSEEDTGNCSVEEESLEAVWLDNSLNKEITDMLMELRAAAAVESEKDSLLVFPTSGQEHDVMKDFMWDEFDDGFSQAKNVVISQ